MNSPKTTLAHDGWLDDDAHEALDILQLLGHVTTLLRFKAMSRSYLNPLGRKRPRAVLGDLIINWFHP